MLKFNVFQFGNIYVRQKNGAAIGGPFSSAWAIIIFALIESKLLKPKFKNNMILLKRFIDDMITIWKRTNESDKEWSDFKKFINECSNLEWLADKPGEAVTFLDLKIWINRKQKRFEWRPNTKELNLFLCLPPQSAHSEGIWKGMIIGML